MNDLLVALALSMTINFMQIALTSYFMFCYVLRRDKKNAESKSNNSNR